MPRCGQKPVPEGKGPVGQGKPGDNLLDEFRRLIQEFKQDFHNQCNEFKQQLGEYGNMEKRLDERMEGMQHKMLQLRPAVETGAKGEDWRAYRRRRRERRTWGYSVQQRE